MPERIYEVLAEAMKYVFTFFGLLIVWRSFAWLRKDRRLNHKQLRQLPDAGTIGELVVIEGSDELPPDTVIPVPVEGVLGCLRTCDMVVPADGVAPRHLDFKFIDGRGLFIYPRKNCPCIVDGEALSSHWDSRAYPMQHGSYLTVGDATLMLRVFAGLKVKDYTALNDLQPEPEFPAGDVPDMPFMPPSQGIPDPQAYIPPNRNAQPFPYPPANPWPLNQGPARRPGDEE